MNLQEIKKEYTLFLQDTNKKDSKKAKNEFKKDFLTWYIKLFGLNDSRTLEAIENLKEL